MIGTKRLWIRSFSFLAAVLLVGTTPTGALATTQIVAISGQAAPDGNGTFSGFGFPVLNDAGQTAFFAFSAGTSGGFADNAGLFRVDRENGSVQIAREGQTVLDGNGIFSQFFSLSINSAGQAAFSGDLTSTSAGSADNRGIFRSDGAAGLVQIAREGQSTHDGNRSFSVLSSTPAINEDGQVAFAGVLTTISDGSGDSGGIFLGDGLTSPAQIVREGQAAPDGNGTFSTFFIAALNDAGQTSFFADLRDTSGGSADNRGIFRAGGATGPVQIVREGQSAPNGIGSFFRLTNSTLNATGQIAFIGFLTETTGGMEDDSGIFLGDGETGLLQIARVGQSAPDGNGSLSGFSSLALNNAEQALFRGSLTGTIGGFADNRGLFLGNEEIGLLQIAREGQSAPDGNGSFSDFGLSKLNDLGQAVFLGFLTSTSGGLADDRGIFFYDEIDGLITVAREGDPLLGSFITQLSYSTGRGTIDSISEPNNSGQVAFRFSLADGREGIALWSMPDSRVPEPSTVLMGVFATLGFIMRRRRWDLKN